MSSTLPLMATSMMVTSPFNGYINLGYCMATKMIHSTIPQVVKYVLQASLCRMLLSLEMMHQVNGLCCSPPPPPLQHSGQQ